MSLRQCIVRSYALLSILLVEMLSWNVKFDPWSAGEKKEKSSAVILNPKTCCAFL